MENLKDVWNDVLRRSRDNNIFSTWEWLSSWWKHFGEGRRLRILLAKERDEIVAIAPLMWSKYKLLRFGKLRKIEFIGTSASDYNVFILTENKPEHLQLFLNYLINCSDWDILELKDIPETSLSADLLRRTIIDLPQKLRNEVIVCNVCPYLSLPDSFGTFMKSLSGRKRKHLRRNMGKLKEEYKVEFKRYDEFGSVKQAMTAFIQLHQEEWRSKNMLGAFYLPGFSDFHLEVAERFAKKGWLGLYFLTVDDRPISAQYTFEYNKKMHLYLTGFSLDYSKYSVGHLILMCAIENCIQKGLKEYDMMRGAEPYKFRRGAKNRKNLEVRFIRRGFLGRMYSWAMKSDTALSIMLKLGIHLTAKR